MVKRLGVTDQDTSCGESVHVTSNRGTIIEVRAVDLDLLKDVGLNNLCLVALVSVRTFNRIAKRNKSFLMPCGQCAV